MYRNKIIGVIGDACIEYGPQYELAYEIGKKLVDSGYIVATGGLGGIMEAASKGASNSDFYDKKSIMAILPNCNPSSANAYADTVLTLGTGIYRNINLVATCDAVIAIGGGAGTLCEISTAWQMGKLIIAVGCIGWSGKLRDSALDNRRDDMIYSADTAEEAISILNEKISLYKKTYSGIGTKFSSDFAINLIKSKRHNEEIYLLGKGESGIVVGNKNHTYKVFFEDSFELKLHLNFICRRFSDFGMKCSVEEVDGKLVISSDIYSMELKKSPFHFSKDEFIDVINIYFFAGLVNTDVKPENFIVTEEKKLLLFDFDKDVFAYIPELFEVFCREVFAVYKLQKYVKENPNKKFKKLIGTLQTDENFSALENLLGEDNMILEYKHFRYSCGEYAVYKNMIYRYFKENVKKNSLFDYGAGTLEIASNLRKKGYEISAYDIDRNIFRAEYSKGINFFSDSGKLTFLIESEKFDTVLCSLVLCCVDDNTAMKIVRNCRKLADTRIIFVICNPLYASSTYSSIQTRKFSSCYSEHSVFKKLMNSTKNIRMEYQRPLGFYEKIFTEDGEFFIDEIVQSGDSNSNYLYIKNSDFMLISLKRVGTK